MKIRKDISKTIDIETLVNEFYFKVRLDPVIGPLFEDVIQDNWPDHLQKMYKFWDSMLLGASTYTGSPFPPHSQMPLEQRHFEIWITLFIGTVDENFEGAIATEAKWRAKKMAEMFLYKIKYYLEHPKKYAI